MSKDGSGDTSHSGGTSNEDTSEVEVPGLAELCAREQCFEACGDTIVMLPAEPSFGFSSRLLSPGPQNSLATSDRGLSAVAYQQGIQIYSEADLSLQAYLPVMWAGNLAMIEGRLFETSDQWTTMWDVASAQPISRWFSGTGGVAWVVGSIEGAPLLRMHDGYSLVDLSSGQPEEMWCLPGENRWVDAAMGRTLVVRREVGEQEQELAVYRTNLHDAPTKPWALLPLKQQAYLFLDHDEILLARLLAQAGEVVYDLSGSKPKELLALDESCDELMGGLVVCGGEAPTHGYDVRGDLSEVALTVRQGQDCLYDAASAAGETFVVSPLVPRRRFSSEEVAGFVCPLSERLSDFGEPTAVSPDETEVVVLRRSSETVERTALDDMSLTSEPSLDPNFANWGQVAWIDDYWVGYTQVLESTENYVDGYPNSGDLLDPPIIYGPSLVRASDGRSTSPLELPGYALDLVGANQTLWIVSEAMPRNENDIAVAPDPTTNLLFSLPLTEPFALVPVPLPSGFASRGVAAQGGDTYVWGLHGAWLLDAAGQAVREFAWTRGAKSAEATNAGLLLTDGEALWLVDRTSGETVTVLEECQDCRVVGAVGSVGFVVTSDPRAHDFEELGISLGHKELLAYETAGAEVQLVGRTTDPEIAHFGAKLHSLGLGVLELTLDP